MGHSVECCDVHSRDLDTALAHQHRLCNCLQQHYVAGRQRSSLVIYRIHLLRLFQALAQGASSRPQIESWSLWIRNQSVLSVVPDFGIHVLLFPTKT